MTSVDDAVLARYKAHGEHFEILVDPVKARSDADIKEILAVEGIFKDAHKGDHASEESLKKCFGTIDIFEVARIIIKKGDVQLTTQQRKDMMDAKRKEIVNLIVSQTVNPQTNSPHPAQRVENAMEEARVKIDAFKKAEDQFEGILSALKPIIPIKVESVKIAIKIPAEYTGKAYGALQKYNRERDAWQNDGAYVCVVTIPAGLQDSLYSEVNSLTKGNAETKELERI